MSTPAETRITDQQIADVEDAARMCGHCATASRLFDLANTLRSLSERSGAEDTARLDALTAIANIRHCKTYPVRWMLCQDGSLTAHIPDDPTWGCATPREAIDRSRQSPPTTQEERA